MAGTWKLELFDSANPGTAAVTHSFVLQHNASSQLGITSPIFHDPLLNNAPVDNALIDLAGDQNYTATDATCPAPVNGQGNPTAACFTAATNSGNSINWQLQLQYGTSGCFVLPLSNCYAEIFDPNGAFLTFTTASGQAQNHVYQNEGGRLTDLEAYTTASDGSSVYDCTTAYIEGPAGGIPGPATPTNPNDIITPELVSLYTQSASYPADGTATSNLMTGVAERETGYKQFATVADQPANSDLWNLAQVWELAAEWPYENVQTSSSPRGKYIGLMQMQTASDQGSDPNA